MTLAGLYFAQKDYRKSASSYARVLVNYPEDQDALSGTAWSALRAGDKSAASATFSLLLGMNPASSQRTRGLQLRRRAGPITRISGQNLHHGYTYLRSHAQ